MRASMGVGASCLVVAIAAWVPHEIGAQPPFEMPWTDQATAHQASEDRVVVTMTAGAELGVRPLSIARAAARRRARRRALRALHRFVDEALSRVRAKPWHAREVHRAVDRHARVLGVRPLSDGGVVVRMAVAGAALRRAAPISGVPWAP